ncbi:hypothetical protein ABFT23_20525 [Nocardioides sp. C4-1]|uniref:hypothetical protein n=1 Tax=Nocardioides sp. C4-1 TaxID=3151851 RepID=UPI0032652D42
MNSRLVLAAVAGLLALGTAPAHAESRVDVTNDRGGSEADLRYQTRLTVEGSGFQTVRGGFGGVYLMFGWVRDPDGGSWRPSRGGLTGADYQYIPDSESAADNRGYLTYVAFPGSSTAGEADAVLSDAGGFRVDLAVPGPVFQAVDRDGDVAEVDCREVTCGVITIGAHGVKNARNETFTPVAFGDVYDVAPATSEPTGTPSAAPTGSSGPATRAPAAQAPAAQAPAAEAPKAAGPAAVTVDRATATAGHAMVFNAQGFTPGEQVVAVLDDGIAALGPMAAGASGEIAGVLQLPVDLGVGTHELRLTGAASGTEVSQRFPVSAAAVPVAVADDGEAADGGRGATVFLVVAVVVLLLALAGSVLARLRGRRPVAPTTAVAP